MTKLSSWLAAPPLLTLLVACGAAGPQQPAPVSPAEVNTPKVADAPWRGASDAEGWHRPAVNEAPLVISGATLWLGDGTVTNEGYLQIERGKITRVAAGPAPNVPGARVIDAQGKVVTPGLIDTHSHLGVYPSPAARAHLDGNEATSPSTSEVRAQDAFWPNDPGIERAIAGGVTTLMVLPGSANLIGGRTITLKLRKGHSARQMHFPGAPDGLKMACGENPKRVYGNKSSAPSTRMGNLAGQRAAFLEAKQLIDEWDRWRKGEKKRLRKFRKQQAEAAAKLKERQQQQEFCAEHGKGPTFKRQCDSWKEGWDEEVTMPELEPGSSPPSRNLGAETLAGALEGQILVHVHCYRADDIVAVLSLADEVGFSVRSFHHGLEAYKLRSEIVKRNISVSSWADWWGFKLEAYDGIPQAMGLLEVAGGKPVIHSDSSEGIQRLNQEASKAVWAAKHAGLKIDEKRALRWITLNAAWTLGIEKRVGTLEKGKDGDVVIWSADPLSVYARAERVFIDGVERYNHSEESKPWSDFELGQER